MPETLLLTGNTYSEWCLERLKKKATALPSKALLAVYQNVACYYACLGVKRHKTMSHAEKQKSATEAYGNFVVDAFLEWLRMEADHEPPAWVTKSLMGKTTFAGMEVLFDPKKDQLWRKYAESGARIRSTLNAIVDTFMVDNADDQELPSGEQAPDLMEHLHQRVWAESEGKPRTMERSEFERALAHGEPIEMLEKVQARDKAKARGKGGEEAKRKSKTNAEGSTGGQGQDSPKSSDSGSLEEEPGDAGDPDVERIKPSDKVTVINSMPTNHVLSNALVFALFGQASTSAMKDLDLDLKSSDGPSNRKKRVKREGDTSSDSSGGSASSSSSEGHLSKYGMIKLMVGAGESQSRAQAKESLQKQGEGVTSNDLKRKLVAALEKSDPQQEKLVEFVAKMSKTMEQDANIRAQDAYIRKRTAEIESVKAEIECVKAAGLSSEAREAIAKLIALYRTPVIHPGTGGATADSASPASRTASDEGGAGNVAGGWGGGPGSDGG